MTAPPKPCCPKCGSHKLKKRLEPKTFVHAGLEKGREYSSITWRYLGCQQCGASLKPIREPLFVKNSDQSGATLDTSTGKIAKDKTSSQPKTGGTSGRQQRSNRRNRPSAQQRSDVGNAS